MNFRKHKHYGKMSIMPQMSLLTFEAESIAYCVSSAFGLDVSDYSLSYIAGWSSDKNIKELRSSLERIRSASDEMITSIDKALERQAKRERMRAARDKER